MTAETADGKTAHFLEHVAKKQGKEKMLLKFTDMDDTGKRHLVKSDATKLEAVEPDLEAKLRSAFARDAYGASLLKIGWHVKEWDDDAMAVVDVARRVAFQEMWRDRGLEFLKCGPGRAPTAHHEARARRRLRRALRRPVVLRRRQY